MLNFLGQIKSERNQQTLDRAIAACRGSARSSSRLSDAARATILQAALGGATRPEPLTPLFFPARWLILATLAPAVLVAVGVVLSQSRLAPPSRTAIRSIQAAKLGDQVVFTIADGNQPHVVYKSTTAERFDRSTGIRVEHSRFVDSAVAGPNLVFYVVE